MFMFLKKNQCSNLKKINVVKSKELFLKASAIYKNIQDP